MEGKQREAIARDLLDIGAVFLRPEQPFTWASGIHSPIYTDNRLILSAPAVRGQVEQALADTVKCHFPEAQMLMGTATAGIAHAALAAALLGLPMGYVRSGNKSHGRENRIEGKLTVGERVVVIEDLISTGGSVLDVVHALQDAGAEVLGIVCIFTYGMQKSREALSAEGIAMESLTDFDTILDVAVQTGRLPAEQVPQLKQFRDHPADESWMAGIARNQKEE
ncbi:orotate phosphoribosyltransferase [Murdochiella vaginalis]|uniref:orotate phosphoribosyltransferase n=1 Tax=Murdochiella vaginalis TaxID=1852373 RepID=UPI0008FDA5C8|nr:orotate phosphoribosyltransferase [Murdochiella vaginalis]